MPTEALEIGVMIFIAVTLIETIKQIVFRLVDSYKKDSHPPAANGYTWLDRKRTEDQFASIRESLNVVANELIKLRDILDRRRKD